MNNKYPLSIIIITNKADDLFEQALSTAQLASEVIIIDNNSQNKFEELNTKYQFVLHQHQSPIVDFSEVRNKALNLAKNDWIFFLDSDESFDKSEFETQILPYLSDQNEDDGTQDHEAIDHIKIKRHDNYLGNKVLFGDVADFHQIRLMKKNSGSFQNKVHEVFEPNKPEKTLANNFTLQHYPHQNFAEFFKKITCYSEVRASEIHEKYITPKYKIILQMLFYPPLKFLYLYFIKLGFLDGLAGFIYSLNMSLHSFFVRVYLYEKLN